MISPHRLQAAARSTSLEKRVAAAARARVVGLVFRPHVRGHAPFRSLSNFSSVGG
jgi:hypothetical protein